MFFCDISHHGNSTPPSHVFLPNAKMTYFADKTIAVLPLIHYKVLPTTSYFFYTNLATALTEIVSTNLLPVLITLKKLLGMNID